MFVSLYMKRCICCRCGRGEIDWLCCRCLLDDSGRDDEPSRLGPCNAAPFKYLAKQSNESAAAECAQRIRISGDKGKPDNTDGRWCTWRAPRSSIRCTQTTHPHARSAGATLRQYLHSASMVTPVQITRSSHSPFTLIRLGVTPTWARRILARYLLPGHVRNAECHL